jgi:hypothetical protein
VTVTWIQLNAQLLCLTGEARFGDEIERSYYNHLSAAQRPDGAKWCYYTPLEGTKPYTNGVCCCLSSGPRGMALAPQLAYLAYHPALLGNGEWGMGNEMSPAADGIAVNLLETSSASFELNGKKVEITQTSQFPRGGGSVLTFIMGEPATFGVAVRAPAWASPLTLQAAPGGAIIGVKGSGWAIIAPREWKSGDAVQIRFSMAARAIQGDHKNTGRTALSYGPFILAADERQSPGAPHVNGMALVAPDDQPVVRLLDDPSVAGPLTPNSGGGDRPGTSVSGALVFQGAMQNGKSGAVQKVTFVPFADAGKTGGRFQVWLHAPGARLSTGSILENGEESRSRNGNVSGSINDGDPSTMVVTYGGQKPAEDWFAVTLETGVTIARVTYIHGHCFHNGGWFDAAAGKPRIQVQRKKGGIWEDVLPLDDYPPTTAADSAGLKDGQSFTVTLKEPAVVFGVRVIGTPAGGDKPAQGFASCAELQAY